MKKIEPYLAFKKFRPEHCVFVLAYDEKHSRPSGMVSGWNMVCSSKPPMYAVALWKEGYTHKLIQKEKEFVVAVPNKGLEKELEFFGSTHGDIVAKFEESKIQSSPAETVKPPLLTDATINYECKLVNMFESGDHFIFVGEVTTAHINEEKKVLMNMKKIDGKRIFQEF